MQKNKSFYVVIVIVFLGFLIRLIHGLSFGFSNDELSALARLQFNGFFEVIEKGVKVDMHPPLVQIFLYYWTKLFGFALTAVRLPFILAGTAAIWYAFKAGKNWFNAETGIIAAAIIAFTGYPILYGEIARPYAFGLLFSLMSLDGFALIFLKKSSSWRSFILLGAGVLLSMYTHYYAFMFTVVVYGSGLFFIPKKAIKKYFITLGFIFLGYLPYLKTFLVQLGYKGVGGDGGWLGKPEAGWFKNYLLYAFNSNVFELLLIAMGFLFSFVFLIKNKRLLPLLLPAWFLFAFAFGYYYSLLVNPILQYSVMLFAFPAIVLFSAHGLSYLRRFLSPVLMAVLFSMTTFAFTDLSGFFKQQHFSQFDLPAKAFQKWSEEYPPETTFSVFNVSSPYYINYYLAPHSDLRFNLTDIDLKSNRQTFLQALTHPNYQNFIFGWSSKYSGREVYSAIRYFYPFHVLEEDYFNSRLDLFSKSPKSVSSANTSIRMGQEKRMIDGSQIFMNSKHIYSPGITKNSLFIADTLLLNIEAHAVISSEQRVNATLVIQGTYGSGENFWYGKKVSEFKTEDTLYHAFASFPLPSDTVEIKELKVFVWNQNKERFSVYEVGYYLGQNLTHSIYQPHYFH